MPILLLNGIPYYLNNRQIVSESTSIANIVQQNDRPYESPIITAAEVTKSIIIEWLAGEKSKTAELALERTCRSIIEASIILLAQQKYLDEEKKRLKVPFTNIPMPEEIQASCGYIGKTMSIMGGFVESFTTNWDMNNNKIIWNLSISVIDLKEERQPKEPSKDLADAASDAMDSGIELKNTGSAVIYGK